MEDTGLSERGLSCKSYTNILSKWGSQANANPFDKATNPEGIVNLGLAENGLCFDIMQEKMHSPEMNVFNRDMQFYSDFCGTKSFRAALAKFISGRFHARKQLDPEQIVVTSGAGAAFDLLAHNLANAGDCFLSFTPTYYHTEIDIWLRSRVRQFHIQLSPKDGYEITNDILEKGLAAAKSAGEVVKGIMLINPHNPTGTTYNADTLRILLHFAKRYDLNVVIDEIYALSVFDKSTEFQSILSLEEILPPHRLYFVWGFSKDFAISGFRCGVVYSENKAFTKSLQTGLMSFGAVPAILQHKMELLITDNEWLDETYLPENIQRMREAHVLCKKQLEEIGVEVYPAKAGFFVWANFSKFLKSADLESERELFEEFFTAGVFVIPGISCNAPEPGWMRITFTLPSEYILEGLSRLQKVLQKRIKAATE